jgi:hypothetical protein
MSVIDTAKTVMDLAKEVNRMDLHQKTVELMGQVTELSHDNFKLNQELLTLKQKQQVQDELEARNSAYFLPSRKISGPFCTKCYDTTGKLVLMKDTKVKDRDSDGNMYNCPNCKMYTGRSMPMEDDDDDSSVSLRRHR